MRLSQIHAITLRHVTKSATGYLGKLGTVLSLSRHRHVETARQTLSNTQRGGNAWLHGILVPTSEMRSSPKGPCRPWSGRTLSRSRASAWCVWAGQGCSLTVLWTEILPCSGELGLQEEETRKAKKENKKVCVDQTRQNCRPEAPRSFCSTSGALATAAPALCFLCNHHDHDHDQSLQRAHQGPFVLATPQLGLSHI